MKRNSAARGRRSCCIETIERRTLLSAGQLDTWFGTGGVTTITFPGGSAELHDLAILHDGRILGAGAYSAPDGSRLVLVRLLPDGRPDATFGGGATVPAGVVDPDVAGGAGRLKLLPNGKFLFAGGSRLIRFNADGSVDPSFTQDEPSRYKFNFNTLAIDVQDDGMILLSGRYKHTMAKPGHFAVARLKGNGTRDRSFGTGGVADFWQHTNSAGTAVRAMSDGSIYVSGHINHGYPNDIDEYTRQDALSVRLLSDGTPDPSFGTDGVARMGGAYFAGAAMTSTLSSDGTATIVAWGDDFRVHRITPDGQRDATWGTDGVISRHNMQANEVRAAAQRDGSLVLYYREYSPAADTFTPRVIRFSPSGADTTFGDELSIPESTMLRAVTFGNDGSILVAGKQDERMVILRLWRDEGPAVQLNAPNLRHAIDGSYRFSVSVRDADSVNASSIDSSDFRVITPDGESIRPTVMSIDARRGPGLIGVNFKFAPPGGSWGPEDNGVWTVRLLSNHVFDTDGNASDGRAIGSLRVRIPEPTETESPLLSDFP